MYEPGSWLHHVERVRYPLERRLGPYAGPRRARWSHEAPGSNVFACFNRPDTLRYGLSAKADAGWMSLHVLAGREHAALYESLRADAGAINDRLEADFAWTGPATETGRESPDHLRVSLMLHDVDWRDRRSAERRAQWLNFAAERVALLGRLFGIPPPRESWAGVAAAE